MTIQIGSQGAATVGSLDPDNTAALTVKMGTGNKADKLIERHAANWPDVLVSALALPVDGLRSEALDVEEVHDALTSLSGREAFFKDDYKLTGAAVRGRTQGERVVSVVYELPSGRVGQGVIPYDGLTISEERFEEFRKRVVDGAMIVDREGWIQEDRTSRETADDVAAGSDDAAVKAAEDRAREAESEKRAAEQRAKDLEARIAALENPEPFPGYEEKSAGDIVRAINEGGVSEYGLVGLQAIVDYEGKREKGARKTIVDAATEVVQDYGRGDGQ